MSHCYLHILSSLLFSVRQCKSLRGEAALCRIQLCGHRHRHEPMGRVISLLLHRTNFTNGENLAKSITIIYHECQLILAVYNKELYEDTEMTGFLCVLFSS